MYNTFRLFHPVGDGLAVVLSDCTRLSAEAMLGLNRYPPDLRDGDGILYVLKRPTIRGIRAGIPKVFPRAVSARAGAGDDPLAIDEAHYSAAGVSDDDCRCCCLRRASLFQDTSLVCILSGGTASAPRRLSASVTALGRNDSFASAVYLLSRSLGASLLVSYLKKGRFNDYPEKCFKMVWSLSGADRLFNRSKKVR